MELPKISFTVTYATFKNKTRPSMKWNTRLIAQTQKHKSYGNVKLATSMVARINPLNGTDIKTGKSSKSCLDLDRPDWGWNSFE